MADFNKLQIVKSDALDKSRVFIEVNSLSWRNPCKISLEELLSQQIPITVSSYNYEPIIIDISTLKIRIGNLENNHSDIHHEFLNGNSISIYQPPNNASEVTGLHMRSDSNYLYIWVNNKWKKVLLSD